VILDHATHAVRNQVWGGCGFELECSLRVRLLHSMLAAATFCSAYLHVQQFCACSPFCIRVP